MIHPIGALLSKPSTATLSLNPSVLFLLLAITLLAGLAAGYPLYRYLESRRSLPFPLNRRKREQTSVQQTDRQQLHAIYDLISGLSASLNYQRVLDNVLDLSASILGLPGGPVERLVSVVLLFSKNQGRPTALCVGSARRLTPADMRILLPGNQGHLRYVIEEGEPVLIRKIAEDPELGRIVSLRACQVAYCIPLRAGLETYGLLLFAHPDLLFYSLPHRAAPDPQPPGCHRHAKRQPL